MYSPAHITPAPPIKAGEICSPNQNQLKNAVQRGMVRPENDNNVAEYRCNKYPYRL